MVRSPETSGDETEEIDGANQTRSGNQNSLFNGWFGLTSTHRHPTVHMSIIGVAGIPTRTSGERYHLLWMYIFFCGDEQMHGRR
jgi:hypothetical protein